MVAMDQETHSGGGGTQVCFTWLMLAVCSAGKDLETEAAAGKAV